MQHILAFLQELRDHNEREWFNDHRAEWKQVQADFNTFVGELIAGIASVDPSIGVLEVRDCTYRIHRDTRFSHDKTPYKTHMGAYIAPRGKKSGYAGYYFHVEPQGDGMLGGSLLSAGLYCPEPVVLRSVRDEIFDNGAEIAVAIHQATGFALAQGNTLKRTPVGFPTGSEYDQMLRLKDIYLEKRVSDAFLTSDHLLEKCVEEFRRTKYFIEILNRAVRFANEEMR